MTATYFQQKFDVATGSNSAAVTIPLPAKGTLTSVTVGTNVAAAGPCYVAIYYGQQTGGNIFIALAYGWTRGMIFPGDESVYWDGRISLDTNLQSQLLALDLRNDTGSTQTLVCTYAVEDR